MILGQSLCGDEASELIGPGGRGLGQIQRDEHMNSPRRATLTGNR
jgi:hypothetical protein